MERTERQDVDMMKSDLKKLETKLQTSTTEFENNELNFIKQLVALEGKF